MKNCKDCEREWKEWGEGGGYSAGLPRPGNNGKRPAPHPGPRCATHHRDRKKALREAAHGRSILKAYGITKEQYEELYADQGGACYICQRANGKTRKLAVDHDHETGYVRGLLCSVCNKMLGHARDNPAMFDIAANYLRNPPAHYVIGKVKPDGQNSGA